ncbi:Serum paraoxonase/arylesterase 1 [Phlyctochytrium planicorne]|nr:Serum paraoxonase/arylesterase 1 [Phlyctochytrium planicorne]
MLVHLFAGFFGVLAVIVAILSPQLIELMAAGGIYPYRTIKPSGPISQCKLYGKDMNMACEDVAIHYPSGTAYLACDDPKHRLKHLPPAGYSNAAFSGSGRVFQLDLKVRPPLLLPPMFSIANSILTRKPMQTNTITPLEIVGFPSNLSTLGIGIWWDHENPTNVILNVINHHIEGSRVEIFEHEIGTNSIHHVDTFQSPDLLPCPNDIQPVGKRSFYVTNDHRFASGALRIMEDAVARPWTHVLYRDENGKTRIVADKIRYANGVVASPDFSKIYVASIMDHAVLVYDRKPNGSLRFVQKVVLDFFGDNLSVNPETGEIMVAGIPKIWDYFSHVFNPTLKSPTWVAKIVNNTDPDLFLGKTYVHKVVLSDDGSLISGGTSAAVDPGTGKTVITPIMSSGVVICDTVL